MKKIIYALVIMIAAGSLFTSCIEPVEPDGILALREAKARYYDALSKLREADGEYRRAEAALKQAEAALKQAEAAHQQAVTDAYTKMQALLREKQEIENASAELDLELKAAEVAQKIDKIQKEMELAEKQHEIDLVNMQNNLAQAQEALRVALRNIELAAQDLTKEEKDCLVAAAAAYYEIYKKVNEQQLKVMKKENALAKAEREAEMAKYNVYDPKTGKGEYVWDTESASYKNAIDYYNGKIEKYEAFIAEDEEILENVPAIDDLEAWGEEIAGYKQAAKELEYSKYTLTQDAAAYYVANVHDGIKTFNDAIDAWKEDPNNKVVADPGDEPAKPQQSQYKYDTTRDSLAIKPLVAVPESEDGFVIYKRFADLVGELDDLQKPTGKFKDTLGKIAKVEKKDGKYQATISATFGIKDLVFGKEDNWKAGKSTELKYQAGDTVKVDVNGAVKYGIDGAISVLARELVLAEEAIDPKAFEDAYNDAKDTWEHDRAVLAAGLAEYTPYKTAKAKLDSLITDNETKGDAMVNAIKNLLEKISDVNEANLSKNDSVEIIKAFREFGAAREKYLKYYHDNRPGKKTKGITPDGVNANKLFFHFAKATDGLDVINDSILFSELSYEALKKGKWNFPVDKDPTVASNSYENPEPNAALGSIAAQLLGEDWGKALAKDPVLGVGWTVPTSLTKDAFYGEYEYVTTDPAHMKCIVPGHEEDPYETDALKDAKDAVNDAIQEYMDIYNAYWSGADYATQIKALTWESTADDIKAAREIELQKGNVGIYNENTFTDPYYIVSFIKGENIVYNDGLGSILLFIDYKVKNSDPNVLPNTLNDGSNQLVETAIFGKAGALTTYGKYLKARQDYVTLGALEAYKEALEAIKAWAKEAKDVFTAAETKNNTDNETAYNNAVTAWETKHQTWETNTGKYEKYMDNLKAFVGVDDDDEPLVADPATLKIPETYKAGVDQIFTIDPLTYGFPLVDTKAWDWIETLGGELKTLAESCFPDFPTEMKGWKDEADRINDEIAHNDILVAALDPVYTASVKVINHDEYPTWKRNQENGEITETNTTLTGSDILALVNDYKEKRNAYIKAVNDDIEHWEGEIVNAKKLIADYEGGADPYVIAVEKAKLELQLAKKELTVLNELLKGAKENLDRIIEYLLSQDVNFINLSGYTSTITTTLK